VPKPHLPTYRFHKHKRCAVVTLNGRDFYLPGAYGSDESRRAYERLLAEWLANGRRLPEVDDQSLSIAELVARFWAHAEQHYRKPDGTVTAELDCFRQALRPMVRLYADISAADFGPLSIAPIR